MDGWEVANGYTFEGDKGECRDVKYRTLDYAKAWAHLERLAHTMGVELPDGETWFNCPRQGFSENYYIMEWVEIDGQSR